MAVLATLPTVSAEASPTPSGILTPVAVTTFSSGEVEAVLSGLPLEDVSATQLSELLAQLPGLSTIPSGPLKESLQKSIETLAGKGDTLGQFGDPTELVSDLGAQLGKSLSIGELLSLLKGQSLTSLLTNGLASLQPNEILGQLLGSSAHPEQLIEQLLGALDPTTFEGLLGSTLAGHPFSKTTVGELATQLGTTPEGLVTDLGTTTSQLPATRATPGGLRAPPKQRPRAPQSSSRTRHRRVALSLLFPPRCHARASRSSASASRVAS